MIELTLSCRIKTQISPSLALRLVAFPSSQIAIQGDQVAREMQLSAVNARLASHKGSRRSRARPAFAALESPSSSYSSQKNSRPQQPQQRLFRSPPPPPPGWDAQVALIDSKPLSKLVLALFRSKMALALNGRDSAEPRGSYEAIVDLTKKLNALPPAETAEKTRGILKSLFPSWLPGAFAVLFSKPLPYLSARINAEATALACEWLMGPTEVNDGGGKSETSREGVEVFSTSSFLSSSSSSAFSSSLSQLEGFGHRTGCKVTYCRYLASTNCVSACLNSCKLPTQRFFERDMGLPLRMSPNLDDFSCQFSFGVSPDREEDLSLARESACLVGCTILSSSSSSGAKGKKEEGEEGDGMCPGSCALRGECGGG